MALWKAHSLNHSQRTTGRSSVPLEETSSNNGAIPCLRYLREMLTCSLAVSKGQKPTGKSNCPVAATNSPRKVLKSSPWARHLFLRLLTFHRFIDIPALLQSEFSLTPAGTKMPGQLN